MSQMADTIRRARESTIKVGNYTFTIRRPTDAEAARLSDQDMIDVVIQFVVGWEGITENDILCNGKGGEVKFDRDTWAEWIVDKPEIWGEISNAIMNAYKKHRGLLEDAGKN